MEPESHCAVFADPEPLSTEFGTPISGLQIEYETWGTLDDDKSNAILICPAFSASSHARSSHSRPESGWWEEMIGPGCAFDTSDYFVICSSLLGSNYGTTGPCAHNHETGRTWQGDFPIVTIRDIVDAQVRLLDHLGIVCLYGAAGGSMGAMEVVDLAVRYPFRVGKVMAFSGTDRTGAYTATIRHVGRRAIMLDPEFAGGFYDEDIPRQGLKLAREIGTIFYRSREDFNTRFSCQPQASPTLKGLTFDFQSYLNHQGNKILGRFDANSYLRLSMAMDLHDLSAGFPSLDDALNQVEAEFLVMGVREDPLIPMDEQLALHHALVGSGKKSSWHELSSRFGHDAFLKEFTWMTPRIRNFLEA